MNLKKSQIKLLINKLIKKYSYLSQYLSRWFKYQLDITKLRINELEFRTKKINLFTNENWKHGK